MRKLYLSDKVIVRWGSLEPQSNNCGSVFCCFPYILKFAGVFCSGNHPRLMGYQRAAAFAKLGNCWRKWQDICDCWKWPFR